MAITTQDPCEPGINSNRKHTDPGKVPDRVSGPQVLWRSELGRRVLEREKPQLAVPLRRLHGETVVWLGSELSCAIPLARCMTRNPVFAWTDGVRAEVPEDVHDSGLTHIVCSPTQLPFRSNSIDGIVVHHALESVEDPRVALREITRVLAPGGRLIVCGFNPISAMGIARLYAKVQKRFARLPAFQHPLAGHRLVNPLRLFDWFTLLGLDLDEAPVYFGYSLPFDPPQQFLRSNAPSASSRTSARAWKLPGTDCRDITREDASTQATQGECVDVTVADEAISKASPDLSGDDPNRRQINMHNLPFAGLVITSATKQAVGGRAVWSQQRPHPELADVAYPRVVQWRQSAKNQ